WIPSDAEGVSGGTRRLSARQELANTVKGAQDVLCRVGVRQPHIALGKDPEVGGADDGDAGIFPQVWASALDLYLSRRHVEICNVGGLHESETTLTVITTSDSVPSAARKC